MGVDFGTFLHHAWDRIEQHFTIKEFYHYFEVVCYLVSSLQPWLLEAKFASRFIYGLRGDIQGYVMCFQPITVLDAFHLACIYEYNFSLDIVDNNVDILLVESTCTMGTTNLCSTDLNEED